MSSTLLLAQTIDAFDREKLASLFRHRTLKKPARDSLELAEMLLSKTSVAEAVQQLPVWLLDALATFTRPGEIDPRDARLLAERGLVANDRGTWAPLPEVRHQLETLRAAAGLSEADVTELAAAFDAAREQLAQLSADGAAAADNADTAETAWYAPALTFTQEVAAMLRSLAEDPGSVGRRGGIAATTVRRIETAFHLEKDTVSRDLSLLLRCGKLRTSDTQGLYLTEAGDAWLQLDHPARWASLAQDFVNSAPLTFTELVRQLSGSVTAAQQHYRGVYPLLAPEELELGDVLAHDFRRLGLTGQAFLTDAAEALLAHDEETARSIAASVFPRPCEGVYVQPDLSVVVPGVLAPDDERALWDVAEVEQIGLASTLRITEASISHAVEHGADAESIRRALHTISLTELPQPLEYLLGTFVDPHNLITVQPVDTPGARSLIVAPNPQLREQITVDRRLSHLRFVRDRSNHEVLYSQLAPNHVLSALRDARYQVMNRAAQQHTVLAEQAGSTPPQKRRDEREAAAADTIAALLNSEKTADMPRLLELAIREQTPLRIVAKAQGREYEFRVLPLALSGQRLRTRDEAAQVERTLPLDSIVAVERLTSNAE